MAPWFSNKGQVIQVVAVVIGTPIAVAVAWGTAPFEVNLVVSAAGVLAVGFLGFLIGKMIDQPRGARQQTITAEHQRTEWEELRLPLKSDKPIGQHYGDPIPPTNLNLAKVEGKLSHSYVGSAEIKALNIMVGDRWNQLDGNVSVEIRSIRKYRKFLSSDASYGAEIKVGGATYSSSVIPVSEGGYLAFPSGRMIREWAAFWCYFDDDGITNWAVSIDHINPHSGLVTLTLMWMRGHKGSDAASETRRDEQLKNRIP